MILLRGITILRDLRRVKTELCFQMRRLIVGIKDGLAILRPQLRIFDGDGLIDRGVSGNICRVMRKRAQRESVLVDILARP